MIQGLVRVRKPEALLQFRPRELIFGIGSNMLHIDLIRLLKSLKVENHGGSTIVFTLSLV
jgi:hypothetical protein